MTVVYLVQHGEKQSLPGDPGLTAKGRQQATRTGRWLRGLGCTPCASGQGQKSTAMHAALAFTP
jgi:broad specificity phosphatase PhoE